MRSFDAVAENFTLLACGISCKGGKRVLMTKKTLWKNNLSFLKDVPIICVNFIISVIVISENKIGGIAFVPTVT